MAAPPCPRVVGSWNERTTLWPRLRAPTYLLLALLGIDLLIRTTADTWDRHSPDDYAARVNGCRQQARDFVFVGGSPVSEGIIPDVIAGVCWNGRMLDTGYALGLPGGTTSEFYHAVKHACPTPPTLLVYGITASDLNDSRHEPHGPASLMTVGDVASWAAARPDSREWVLRTFLREKAGQAWALYRYRHGIRMWAAIQADAVFPGSCPDTIREAAELRAYANALHSGNGYAPAAGFVTRRYDVVKAVNAPLPPFTFLDRYKTGSHLTYLHRLIGWAEDRGTALVLVDMPVTADLEAQHPAAFAEYRRLLAEIEQAGLPVIRAHRDRVGITDAGFADTIHLNGVGAQRLSAWVRAQLEELGGDISDPHSVARGQMEGATP
jgi:hypothetical protein